MIEDFFHDDHDDEGLDGEPVPRAAPAASPSSKSPPQATILADLALDRYRFVRSAAGDPFAVEIDGTCVASPLRGNDSLRTELARTFMREYGQAPRQGALTDALCVLEGAAADGAHERVELRVARDGDHIYLDLGEADGTTICVSPTGWTETQRPPLLWRRTVLTGPIPAPVRGGRIEDLEALLNVAGTDQFDLVVAWLVAALIPDIPHPVLTAVGEQGTGKTTAVRMLVELVDPSPAPLRTAPRDEQGWAVAAAGSWVVALDNVSSLAPWLQDALCRAVTGDALVRRRLYSDSDIAVLAYQRVIALTSIDPGALRGDLGDRMVLLDLERISPSQRLLDRDLADRFETLRPGLYGALLDLLAAVLAVLPTIKLDAMPRMADFARVCAAVDRVRNTNTLDTYMACTTKLAAAVVEADPVAVAVTALVNTTGEWQGTATELLAAIAPERPPKGWPGSAGVLSGRLKRAAPALRDLGIEIEFSTTHKTKTITILNTKDPTDPNRGVRGRNEASPATEASPTASDQGIRGDASGDASATGDATTPTMRPPHPEPDMPLDLHKRGRGDAGDAGDACVQPSSTCTRCSAHLWRATSSTDTDPLCKTCRAEDTTATEDDADALYL